MAKKSAEEIRKEITDRFVESIKKGLPPWRKMWVNSPNSGFPCNFFTGRHYSGINPMILMWSSFLYNFESKYWGTASSWLKYVGACPKKNEFETDVVLFRYIPKTDRKTGKVERNKHGLEKAVPIIRQFPLLNADQLEVPSREQLLDGKTEIVTTMLGNASRTVTTRPDLLRLAKKYGGRKLDPNSSLDHIIQMIRDGIRNKLNQYLCILKTTQTLPNFEPAEKLIAASGASLRHGGDKAFYTPRPRDFIQVPNKERFSNVSDYYETVFHEMIHWTEDKERVGQKKGHTYAFGELVAEIGACFLLMELGVPLADNMLVNSQSYIANWLKSMGDDPKFIFDAAAQASKAADYLQKLINDKKAA